VTVQVATPHESFLVFSDAFYPGWRAYVDGLERPILRGNMLFRVVQVPEGSHDVVFRFEPLSVLLGLTILSRQSRSRWACWSRTSGHHGVQIARPDLPRVAVEQRRDEGTRGVDGTVAIARFAERGDASTNFRGR
jgi:hypothetical protein